MDIYLISLFFNEGKLGNEIPILEIKSELRSFFSLLYIFNLCIGIKTGLVSIDLFFKKLINLFFSLKFLHKIFINQKVWRVFLFCSWNVIGHLFKNFLYFLKILTFFQELECPHLGPKTIETIYENGFTSIPSFLSITKNDLLNTGKYKDKSAYNILQGIQVCKNNLIEMSLKSSLFYESSLFKIWKLI